jgi:hypothetical protein
MGEYQPEARGGGAAAAVAGAGGVIFGVRHYMPLKKSVWLGIRLAVSWPRVSMLCIPNTVLFSIKFLQCSHQPARRPSSTSFVDYFVV